MDVITNITKTISKKKMKNSAKTKKKILFFTGKAINKLNRMNIFDF